MNEVVINHAVTIREANDRLGKSFVEWALIVSEALLDAQQSRAWDRSSTFSAWCLESFGWQRSHVHQILDAGRVIRRLQIRNVEQLPQRESHCRALRLVPASRIADVWAAVIAESKDTNRAITGHMIRRIAKSSSRDPNRNNDPDAVIERLENYVTKTLTSLSPKQQIDAVESIQAIIEPLKKKPKPKREARPKRDYKLTHITAEKAMYASKCAAQKWFSNDQAIGQDDLESIALVRILERDPMNVATAIHVGGEGILRQIKYRRYENGCNTVQFSQAKHIDGDDEVNLLDGGVKPLRESEDTPALKMERHCARLAKQAEAKKFGKFGLAVPDSKKTKVLRNRFKSTLDIDNKPKITVRTPIITDKLTELANNIFVLAVLI